MNYDYLMFIGVAIIIFVIFREIVTWYWKINMIVDLLKQIERNTRIPEIENEALPVDSESKNEPTGSVWRDGKWGPK